MKGGKRPAHLIPWAPADYLTSRTRMRAVRSGDHLLRLVYREVLDVLYAEGGAVRLDALHDLTALPQEEIDRCVAICVELGSLSVEEGEVRNARVSRTLGELADVRERRASGGSAGAAFGYLGPLSQKTRKEPLKGQAIAPSGYGYGIGTGSSSKGGAGGERETWLTPFGKAWEAALGGQPSWGQIAKEFKPLVERLGAEPVLAGWRRYLSETEGKYASPAAFAKRVGLWVKKAPPPPRPKPKLPPATKATMDRWGRARERVEMPEHLKHTWLSPVEAHSISDTGILSLIVPSKTHAEAMRRWEKKIIDAFNAVPGGSTDATGVCSIVIEPDDRVLHDGGL